MRGYRYKPRAFPEAVTGPGDMVRRGGTKTIKAKGNDRDETREIKARGFVRPKRNGEGYGLGCANRGRWKGGNCDK